MDTKGKFKIVLTRAYEVSVEAVFDAWLTPSLARQFLFATENGEMIRADIDPEVGGEFCFVERRDDEEIEHLGEYLEIDQPRRIVFVFAVNRAPDFTRVTLDFALRPASAGVEAGSQLTLTHEMDPKYASYADRTRQGWEIVLDRLAKAL